MYMTFNKKKNIFDIGNYALRFANSELSFEQYIMAFKQKKYDIEV